MSTQVAPAPYTDAPVHDGLEVFTLDNKRLGTVKEMAENHFKVDVRFRRDYWLSNAQIAYVDEHCVGLLFRSDEAELYKLTGPSDDNLARSFERRGYPSSDVGADPSTRRNFPLS